jgi:hypothetical protein
MKSLNSFLLLVLLPLFVCADACLAEGVACHKTPLVEIDYDAFGMLAPQGKYLYFRVCEDGMLQYEVEGSSSGIKEMRGERLTDSQLASLRGLLETSEVKTLQGTYDSKSKFRDYRLTLAVRVRRPQGIQTFSIVNILSNTQGSFPQSVLRFLCAIDKLRKTDFKLSHECSP